jgi:predicted Rossmann fold nucleotide-binding protein DprA/Smf involved in DNA uptake
MNIDAICRVVGMPVYKLSSLLLQMEFNGIIRCYPGNLYKIVN